MSWCSFGFAILALIVSSYAQAQGTSTSYNQFVKIDPKGTYLLVDAEPKGEGFPANYRPDIKYPPTVLDLNPLVLNPAIQLKAGDLIGLQQVGAFKFSRSNSFQDNIDGTWATFAGQNGPIAAGSLTTAPPVVTLPTNFRGFPTDIPEDFYLPPNEIVFVQVPPGATSIWFSGLDNLFEDNNDPNNDYGVNVYVVGYPVSMTIGEVRVGQTVFNPQISALSPSVALVSGKSFGIEVNLKATVPDKHKSREARIVASVDGRDFATSEPFKIGDIAPAQSKAFLFSGTGGLSAGDYEMSVRVVPVEPIPGEFEESMYTEVSIPVTVHETAMKLYVTELRGCINGPVGCYQPPTSSDRQTLFSSAIPFAQKHLPVSGGKLISTSLVNLSLSFAGRPEYLQRDATFVWLGQKLTFSDFGVALVGSDYFKRNRMLPDMNVGGLFLHDVAFVTGGSAPVLAHELTHGLGLDHGPSDPVEGMWSQSDPIFTNGISLHSSRPVGTFATNFFAETLDSSVSQDVLGLDVATYNSALKKLVTGAVDPKVVLVTGVLDSSNRVIDQNIVRGESFLGADLPSGDIEIKGLDRAGRTVTSVRVKSENSVKVIANGVSQSLVLPSRSFVAVLPDDDSIESVQASRDGVVILKSNVKDIGLTRIINGLNASSFKSSILGKLYLDLARQLFAQYSKYRLERKRVSAIVALKLLKGHLLLNLKPSFNLTGGLTVTLAEVRSAIEREEDSLGARTNLKRFKNRWKEQ